jgi:hypothetical protein
MYTIGKREFLTACAALGLGMTAAQLAPAFAQHDSPASGGAGSKGPKRGRTAGTTRLFKAPEIYPNALAIGEEGLWIGQQKMFGAGARRAKAPEQKGPEKIWLMDWKGKLLKTVEHTAFNTSGLAYGGGILYPLGNADTLDGAFLIDAKSGKTLEHRALPLGGGGCHGGQFHDGKLWLVENRLNCLMRIDPKSWTPEWAMPIYSQTEETKRWHDMTFDDQGFLWLVTGNDSKSPLTGRAGLAKYNATTGECLEYVAFRPGTCDPHGLVFHNGKFISCDAGHHPGWTDQASKDTGWIFSIEIA